MTETPRCPTCGAPNPHGTPCQAKKFMKAVEKAIKKQERQREQKKGKR